MARIYDDDWIHVPVQRMDGLRGVSQTPQLPGLRVCVGRQPWQVRGARAGRKSEDALVRARPCRFVALLGRFNCSLCRETTRTSRCRLGIPGICLARGDARRLLWPPTPPLQRTNAPRTTRKALERANRRERISQKARRRSALNAKATAPGPAHSSHECYAYTRNAIALPCYSGRYESRRIAV
jgi:hypothetical protein